jgi:hypothetical protein
LEQFSEDPFDNEYDDLPKSTPVNSYAPKETGIRNGYKERICRLAKAAAISYRCGEIRNIFRERYKCKETGSEVTIHFVSAQDYDKGKLRHTWRKRPLLMGESSGITSLQNNLLLLTRQGRLESLRRHLQEDCVQLYRTIQCVSSNDRSEQGLDHLQDIHSEEFDDWQSQITRQIDDHLKPSLDRLRNIIVDAIHKHFKTEHIHAVLAQCRQWNYVDFSGVCRAGGINHRTNDDLISPILKLFEKAQSQCEAPSRIMANGVMEVLQAEIRDRDRRILSFIARLDMNPINMHIALQHWGGIRARTDAAIVRFCEGLNRAIRGCLMSIMQPENESAPIMKVMGPIFRGIDQKFATSKTEEIRHFDKIHGQVLDCFTAPKFRQDVAEEWHKAIDRSLKLPKKTLASEPRGISTNWYDLIKLMKPVTEELSPESAFARGELRRDLNELQNIFNSLGNIAELQNTLIPDPPLKED